MLFDQQPNIQGVGLNLRLEFIDEVINQKPELSLLEIIVDNYFSPGPHHKKLEKLRQYYEVSFHCTGMNLAGVDPLDKTYFKKLKELKEKFKPIHISDHLCFQAFGGHYHHDLLPFPFNNQNLMNIKERVSYIHDYLEEEILVENLSYYIEFKNSEMSEAEFLRELTRETGCYILLDLNNIWVNEKNLGIKAGQYLEELSFDSVKEVHLAGAENFNDTYIDTHGANIHEEVLELLSKYKKDLKRLPIIYERDNNIPNYYEISNELSRIRSFL